MNCPYCHREGDNMDTPLSQNLLDLINKHYEKENHKISIKFMGGEPSLYMKDIETIVNLFPDAVFQITTNGKSFNKYKDFYLKNKFFVVLSYDGTSIRGYDPLNEKIDYPYLGISSVIYNENYNLYETLREFTKKEEIIGRKISFYPHIFHYTNEENSKFQLSEDQLDELIFIYKSILKDFVISLKSGMINRKYEGMFFSIAKRYFFNYSYGETSCSNRDIIKVDRYGREYTCHYIRTNEINDKNRKERIVDEINQAILPCNNCQWYFACGAACIKSKNHKMECRFYKSIFKFFKALYDKNKEVIDNHLKGVDSYESIK